MVAADPLGTEPQGSAALHVATVRASHNNSTCRDRHHRACSGNHKHRSKLAAMDCLMSQANLATMHHQEQFHHRHQQRQEQQQARQQEEQFHHRHQQRQEQRQPQARTARRAPCAASVRVIMRCGAMHCAPMVWIVTMPCAWVVTSSTYTQAVTQTTVLVTALAPVTPRRLRSRDQGRANRQTSSSACLGCYLAR